MYLFEILQIFWNCNFKRMENICFYQITTFILFDPGKVEFFILSWKT